MIVLTNIRATDENNQASVIADIKSDSFGDDKIWFSVPVKQQHYLTVNRYDAFLVALLYPAMRYGEDIHIAGAISKKLHRNILTYVQAVLTAYSPSLKRIKITADSFSEEKTVTAAGIGTGFSGGVDSFCTIYDHFVLEKDERCRINTLIFLNVGSHGLYSNPDTENKFLKRYEYLHEFPKSVNLAFIKVNSNIHKFHEEFGHQKTCTLTTASGILALQGTISKYYISSAISYSEMMSFGKFSKDFDITEYSDPYLLPLLGTESIEFIADGQQYSRTEKTIHIAEYEPVKKYLNVCINGERLDAGNCSFCPKCLRTIMTLESAGVLAEFQDVFDISIYREHAFRYQCLQLLKYKTDVFAKDNIDFARGNGKWLPSYFVAAVLFCMPRMIMTGMRRVGRKLLDMEKYNKLKHWLRHR
ncbi:MAG: hypothetical protein LBR93_02525 [Treponema sp.]|jgi:hypothetical protein|nr:hypothetical protein [Treponema sp.]